MATAAKLDVEVLHPATDIMLVVEETPQIVLLEPEKFDQFYARVKAETETLVPDLATKRGRDEIRSMAAKVVRSKTMIDKARLQLTGQWREQTSQVNAAGKDIAQRLEVLADEVRRPLTQWETAEKERVESCRADIEAFKRAAVVTMEDTAATVRERGAEVWGQALDPDRFGDMLGEAQAAKETAVATLKAALGRLVQEEADRAELEKLRAEAAEREERERIEREAREVQERAAAEAKAEEERRAEVERTEAERIERARTEAAENARREAEETARQEREAAEREKQAEINAANERARLAEASAQAERDAAERAERERIQAAEAEAAEQAKRDKNRAHRGRVMGEVKSALMTCGADEETAKKIVLAIVAGEVPAVTLRF